MSEASGTSRILTLVFTDLADSTALKTQRGDHAVGELITRHRAHVRRLATHSGGRIVDWAGDGCFLTFEMPSAAVLFALRLQQVHHEESDLPSVRTGIHMGEVSERPGPDGDAAHPRVEGLVVDLAARTSGLARPGQILTSAAVADSARQRLDADAFQHPVRWRTHGGYTLKGFDETLQIREVGLEGVAPFTAPGTGDRARPEPPASSPTPRRRALGVAIAALLVVAGGGAYLMWSRGGSRVGGVHPGGALSGAVEKIGSGPFAIADRPVIAVLPLDNFSSDPEQAFFANGLAEDLITRLAAWRSFPVIARNSSFKYRGGNLDLKTVGEELGARYLVEGSVRREDDRIRVSAQLIDVPSGEHIWAETYDRDVEDVFAVQDEISGIIAATIASDVHRAEAERARRLDPEAIQAWSLYALGLQRAYRNERDDNVEARRLCERALARDPGFAAALALVSLTHSWDVGYDWTDTPDQSATAALDAARRALDLDPREPRAYAALASASLAAGDAHGGLGAARRAVDLNPSMQEAWIELARAQLLSGDPDGCIASSQHALRLNPQGESSTVAWDRTSLAYWETGRFEESLAAARLLVAVRPDYWWGQVELALNAVSLGRVDEAHAAIAEASRLQPGLSLAKIQRAFGISRLKVDARRNAALRLAGLE